MKNIYVSFNRYVVKPPLIMTVLRYLIFKIGWNINAIHKNYTLCSVHRHVILSVNLSNGRYEISRFLIFQVGDCPQSTVSDWWSVFCNNPKRGPEGLYCCAKCGLNRFSSFENTKVGIYCTFGLSTLPNSDLGDI